MTRLPIHKIIGHTFTAVGTKDQATVIAFHPSTGMWEMSGTYPGGFPDVWATPTLWSYGIDPEFSPEELERIEELRKTNLLIEEASRKKAELIASFLGWRGL